MSIGLRLVRYSLIDKRVETLTMRLMNEKGDVQKAYINVYIDMCNTYICIYGMYNCVDLFSTVSINFCYCLIETQSPADNCI